MAWDFLVRKDDLASTDVRPTAATEAVELEDGEVLLEVERFALTANNITYGLVGERLGYWRFFPAPDGWGRIPAWGFARVRRSRAADIPEGLRLYGYLPMSTHVATRLRRTATGAADVSEHRSMLPAAYNAYAEAPETATDDQLAVLRPLYMTSFLLDDWLAENRDFGAGTILLSSASSKTALGLAALLAGRGARVIGLTSEVNRPFLESLGHFDSVEDYQNINHLAPEPALFVDFAGDAGVRRAIRERYDDLLALSAVVGSTHRGAAADGLPPLPGPTPTFFFAPDRVKLRIGDWGAAAFNERISHPLERFIASASWLRIERHRGAAALTDVYENVLRGNSSPAVAHVVVPAA